MSSVDLRSAKELGRSKTEASERLRAFLVATAIFLFLHQHHDVQEFFWDAKDYWRLSDPSVFFHFAKEIRGYVYPMLLLPAHLASNFLQSLEAPAYPYRVYSAVAYGYLASNLLPDVYVRICGGHLNLVRRLIVPVLLAALLPGMIIYPLSDLPAFFLMIGALWAVLNALTANSSRYLGLMMLLAGMLATASYNSRTVYGLPVIALFLASVALSGGDKNRRLLATVSFIAGVALVSLPQSVINASTRGSWSPAVTPQKSEKSLVALQLMWGITIQKYETTVDAAAVSPSRYYMDRSGEKIFAEEGLENSEVDVSTYISLVQRRPLEFAGIYGRHLVNGLDIRDGEVYIRSAGSSRNLAAFFNQLVLSLGALVLLIRYRRSATCSSDVPTAGAAQGRRAASTWPVWLFVWLLPVLLILPGAVETRFFLPLHALVYCTIAFNLVPAELMRFVRQHWGVLTLAYVILLAMFFAVATNTASSMQPLIHPPYRFGQ